MYNNGNGQEPKIKPDPESVGNSPAAQDDDIYEDTGDLDFSGANPALYLTRIPKFLWEQWSNLDDNQEIQIGTLRVEGSLNDVKRVRSKTSYSVLSPLLIRLDADESHVIAESTTKPISTERVQHAGHEFKQHQHIHIHGEGSTRLQEIYT